MLEITPTYLRVGGGLFPVWGDALRGWGLAPDDLPQLGERSPYAYGSVEELFFVLVNLWTAASTPQPTH